jgi:hypothetical protein
MNLSDQPSVACWNVAHPNWGPVASAVPKVSSEYDELLSFDVSVSVHHI